MKHNTLQSCTLLRAIVLISLLYCNIAATQGQETHMVQWNVQYANVTRLCHTKSIITINGQFPGPTLYVTEGDTVIINVTNFVNTPITIHWHGLRQFLSAWADGPAYITQCPIKPNSSYVHRFQIVEQRGTLLYHAHASWLRATVHGAFIINPKGSMILPFSPPTLELSEPIIIGEWWTEDTEQVIQNALAGGAGYDNSNATTINGQPGVLYNCSLSDTKVLKVIPGQRYILRVINAAMNFIMYFAVKNHSLTVVEADAEYTKDYTTDVVVLAPGQTTSLVLQTFEQAEAGSQYLIAASIFSPPNKSTVPFNTIPGTAILQYDTSSTAGSTADPASSSLLPLPDFPAADDSDYVMNFTRCLRSWSFSEGYYYYPCPDTVDEDLFFTIGYGMQPCPSCTSPAFYPDRIAAEINNVTFQTPNISILEAFYNNITGVYEADFPDKPINGLINTNYTQPLPAGVNNLTLLATKVKVLEFHKTVQIVFQDTSVLFFQNHPMHLHGQNFFVVGSGFGNYDPNSDPANFNLVDPPSRNTVAVPAGGWAAVRFNTTNPGVWYLHCHLDIHSTWGMSMAFIVKNGVGPNQTLPPPPSDLPSCS